MSGHDLCQCGHHRDDHADGVCLADQTAHDDGLCLCEKFLAMERCPKKVRKRRCLRVAGHLGVCNPNASEPHAPWIHRSPHVLAQDEKERCTKGRCRQRVKAIAANRCGGILFGTRDDPGHGCGKFCCDKHLVGSGLGPFYCETCDYKRKEGLS